MSDFVLCTGGVSEGGCAPLRSWKILYFWNWNRVIWWILLGANLWWWVKKQFYRWPRDDLIPMTRFWCRWQQTAKTTTNHTVQCNDLRPVVNRVYHHVYHCRCNKYWHLSLKLMSYVLKRKLYKTRWTDKKPKLVALSWTNVRFSERLICALRVRAANANGMTKSCVGRLDTWLVHLW